MLDIVMTGFGFGIGLMLVYILVTVAEILVDRFYWNWRNNQERDDFWKNYKPNKDD